MGEAKRRAQAREQIRASVEQVDMPRLSSALRRLATAASDRFGSDCYIHAAIAQEILRLLGVPSKLCAGYAAWRVGDGDSDVILHAPTHNMVKQEGGLAYHVWLEIGHHILDLTTYQLRAKAVHLDDLDGGNTDVVWCPDYLYVPKKSVSSIRDVRQLNAGLYYYESVSEVETKVIVSAPELDAEDVQAVWVLYLNQGLQVIGPNNMKCKVNHHE